MAPVEASNVATEDLALVKTSDTWTVTVDAGVTPVDGYFRAKVAVEDGNGHLATSQDYIRYFWFDWLGSLYVPMWASVDTSQGWDYDTGFDMSVMEQSNPFKFVVSDDNGNRIGETASSTQMSGKYTTYVLEDTLYSEVPTCENNQGFLHSNGVAYSFESVNEVPSSTSADANKVLTVDSNGTPTWGTAPSGLPASTSADEGKVLTVDSNGDAEWDNPVQADWNESSSSSPAYINNKPTIPVIPAMKSIVAGQNVSITEDANGVTISTTVDETVLWSETGTSDIGEKKYAEYNLSEAAENFERVRLYFARGAGFYGEQIIEVNPSSGYGKLATLHAYDTSYANMYVYFCAFTLSSSKYTETSGGCGFYQPVNGSSAGSTVNKSGNWLHPYKIVGVNRIASN